MEQSVSPDNLESNLPKETPKQGESLGRKSLEVNGRKVSYVELGDPKGIPFLYLQGWTALIESDMPFLRALAGDVPESRGLKILSENKPESAHRIAARARALEGKYRIIDLDLPGQGQSEPLKKASFDNVAEHIVVFQRALGIKKAIIFGSSMGGVLGIKIAANNPELVETLIVQGPPTKPGDIAKEQDRIRKLATLGPVPYILYATRLAYWIDERQKRKSEEFNWSDKESQEAMIKGFRTAHPRTAIETLREFGADLEEDIKSVKCPVIVIDGVDAQLVSIMKSAELAGRFHQDASPSENIAQRKLVFLPIGGQAGKHGHTIVNTFPEGLAVAIDDVLDKMLPRDQKPAA